MKRFTILLSFLIIINLFIAGCGTTSSEQNSQPKEQLQVYTSIYPIYEFAKQVGGDKISVKNIIPAGSEPHEWEPSPQIIAEVTKADVLILSGSGVEPWADKVLGVIDQSKVKVIYAGQNIELIEGIAHEHGEEAGQHEDEHQAALPEEDKHVEENSKHEEEHEHSHKDPHIWLDPLNAKTMVDNILAGLVKVDNKNRSTYEANAAAYKKDLDQLHQEYENGLANVKIKEFVTSHAAFGYLAKRYNLVQVPVRGLTADTEPSPADMAAIVKLAKEKGIKYIFFETLVSPKVSETIASELNGQTLVLNPIESLTDQEIAAGKNYLTVMRENLKNLKIALGAV